jgi:hypothetical protein|tara:strand:+ start:771 stop:977 length:207 start_codon:yes stop_codon:yes gene_type:complete
MILPTPSQYYDPLVQSEINRSIELGDSNNLKKDGDLEIGNGRIILTSANGTRYKLTVDNSGNLGTAAI